VFLIFIHLHRLSLDFYTDGWMDGRTDSLDRQTDDTLLRRGDETDINESYVLRCVLEVFVKEA